MAVTRVGFGGPADAYAGFAAKGAQERGFVPQLTRVGFGGSFDAYGTFLPKHEVVIEVALGLALLASYSPTVRLRGSSVTTINLSGSRG